MLTIKLIKIGYSVFDTDGGTAHVYTLCLHSPFIIQVCQNQDVIFYNFDGQRSIRI